MAKRKAKKAANSGARTWAIFSLVSALIGANLAKKVLNSGWRAATGKKPPANPADPDVQIGEAVLWAAVSGTFVAIARMLATRKAANYFAKSTGKLPPGLRSDEDEAAEQAAIEAEERQATAEKSKKKRKKAKV
jgi:Protein of unknown function (DUF4235)